MTIRKATIALAVTCAALLIAPMAASATTTSATSFKSAPVSGVAHNGKAFKGHFTVSQFVTKNGSTYAVGKLTGTLGNRTIKPTTVSMPTTLPTGSATTTAATTCPILHLDLGPLNLTLLGLNVHLNQVVLDITATQGNGNLLGNLLCSVSNLLNGSGLPTGTVTSLLNLVNTVLGNLGVLNL